MRPKRGQWERNKRRILLVRNEMSSSSKSNNGLAKQDKKKSKTLRSKHTKMIIRSDKA